LTFLICPSTSRVVSTKEAPVLVRVEFGVGLHIPTLKSCRAPYQAPRPANGWPTLLPSVPVPRVAHHAHSARSQRHARYARHARHARLLAPYTAPALPLTLERRRSTPNMFTQGGSSSSSALQARSSSTKDRLGTSCHPCAFDALKSLEPKNIGFLRPTTYQRKTDPAQQKRRPQQPLRSLLCC